MNYSEQSKYAKLFGYQSIGIALSKLGKNKFFDYVKEVEQSKNKLDAITKIREFLNPSPIKEEYSYEENNQIIFEPKKIEPEIEPEKKKSKHSPAENKKSVKERKNYIIFGEVNNPKHIDIGKYIVYENGKVWSKFKRGFMSPTKHEVIYYSYQLDERKRHLIHRLVYFYFCNHNYTDISQLKKIVFLKPELGIFPENLVELTDTELHLKYNINFSAESAKRGWSKYQKIPDTDLEKVTKLLETKSYREVGELYDTTITSVMRYVNRHKIKINRKIC